MSDSGSGIAKLFRNVFSSLVTIINSLYELCKISVDGGMAHMHSPVW